MLAIHNSTNSKQNAKNAANAFAKLSKCQQFTTIILKTISNIMLQTLLQSYQNVSNSQRCTAHVFSYIAANAFAKLSKCQQFTTEQDAVSRKKWLQTLLQSYQNVSNSQHNHQQSLNYSCCKRFCKVIKMLAIHNYTSPNSFNLAVANAFAKLSKCQQFTTGTLYRSTFENLQLMGAW